MIVIVFFIDFITGCYHFYYIYYFDFVQIKKILSSFLGISKIFYNFVAISRYFYFIIQTLY